VATGDGVVCEQNFTSTSSSPETENITLSKSNSQVNSLLDLALLVFPFFAWGSSMPALKLVMPHISSPLLLGAIRLLPAGAILVAWAAATRRTHPTSLQAFMWITLFGLVDGAAFQGFLAEGLSKTGAGLGSVVIDSQPLTVAVLAAVLFGERLGPYAVSGLFLGVLGLLLVELPPEVLGDLAKGLISTPDATAVELMKGISFSNFGESGEFWMLCAAQSMAVGTVMVRYVTQHADSIYATGYHMLLGGAVLLAVLAIQDPHAIQDAVQAATAEDIATLTYVSMIGGAASYGIFFYNVSVRGNLTALSSLTFLTPLFALGTGFALLGETLTQQQFFGAIVTLMAVYFINYGKSDLKS
jgi:drug/metabolite transporter (DMT)-like permease